MTDTNAVIAVYDNHAAAEGAGEGTSEVRLRHEEVVSCGDGRGGSRRFECHRAVCTA